MRRTQYVALIIENVYAYIIRLDKLLTPMSLPGDAQYEHSHFIHTHVKHLLFICPSSK